MYLVSEWIAFQFKVILWTWIYKDQVPCRWFAFWSNCAGETESVSSRRIVLHISRCKEVAHCYRVKASFSWSIKNTAQVSSRSSYHRARVSHLTHTWNHSERIERLLNSWRVCSVSVFNSSALISSYQWVWIQARIHDLNLHWLIDVNWSWWSTNSLCCRVVGQVSLYFNCSHSSKTEIVAVNTKGAIWLMIDDWYAGLICSNAFESGSVRYVST